MSLSRHWKLSRTDLFGNTTTKSGVSGDMLTVKSVRYAVIYFATLLRDKYSFAHPSLVRNVLFNNMVDCDVLSERDLEKCRTHSHHIQSVIQDCISTKDQTKTSHIMPYLIPIPINLKWEERRNRVMLYVTTSAVLLSATSPDKVYDWDFSENYIYPNYLTFTSRKNYIYRNVPNVEEIMSQYAEDYDRYEKIYKP